MKQAGAWLLTIAPGRMVAIGERELNHLIHAPKSYAIPRTPRHCARVIEWDGQILPVWDLATWLLDTPPAEPITMAAVVGYQRTRREPPRFGALALPSPPVRAMVRDDQACALPSNNPALQALAISCFTNESQSVPIIDLTQMFSSALVTGRSTTTAAPASLAQPRKLEMTS